MRSTDIMTINFNEETFKPTISVTQYDTGKYIRCFIAGISGEVSTSFMYCRKPSGLEVFADAEVINDHTIEFKLEPQITVETGVCECQLQLFGEDKSLTSYKFQIRVRENMMEESRMTSSDDYPAFRDSIQKLTAASKDYLDKLNIEIEDRQKSDETEKVIREQADLQEKTERQAEIDVERKRINNLTKLGEGSTTGDAELQDIRVGYDGTEYENAGEAVRGQVGSLSEDMDMRYINKVPIKHGYAWNYNDGSNYVSEEYMCSEIKIPVIDSLTYFIAEKWLKFVDIVFYNSDGERLGDYRENNFYDNFKEYTYFDIPTSFSEPVTSIGITFYDDIEVNYINIIGYANINHILEYSEQFSEIKKILFPACLTKIDDYNETALINNKWLNHSKILTPGKYVIKVSNSTVNDVVVRFYCYDDTITPTFFSEKKPLNEIESIEFSIEKDMAGYGYHIEDDKINAENPVTITASMYESGEVYNAIQKNGAEIEDIKKYVWRPEIVICSGDSITQSVRATEESKTYPSILQQFIGNSCVVKNTGVSGAVMANITGRLNAIPMFISEDIVLDSTGKAVVENTDIFKSSYPSFESPRLAKLVNPSGKPNLNPCYIDGHECTVTIKTVEDKNVLEIQANDISDSIKLNSGSIMVFNCGKEALNGITVLMMGTNGWYDNAEDYVEQYKKVADYLGNSKYLMLSQFDVHFTADGTYLAYSNAQASGLNTLKANENAMSNIFGAKFINMREELVKNGLEYAIEGGSLNESCLTSPNNIDAISKGYVPFGDDFDMQSYGNYHNGLLFDVHPNNAGNYSIAKIVYLRGKALGYWY